MTFELWETESGNIIGGYQTEAAALQAVREVVCPHGAEVVQSWLLTQEDKRGRSKALLSGSALAERALNLVSA